MSSSLGYVGASIGVVIPAYKASRTILEVIRTIGPEVNKIVVVDDCCPEGTGKIVKSKSEDKRVLVIMNDINQGVGGATLRGMQALADECEAMVKIDADGQMDCSNIPLVAAPIISKEADYVKGTRFQSVAHLREMPAIRLIGNAGLSLMSKGSSGYWSVSDPTNGFIAISAPVFKLLDLEKIAKDYFFESDMLFRLGLMGAVVREIPMASIYGDEESNLSISKALISFPSRHFSRAFKRIIYKYFVYRWTVGTILLLFGAGLTVFGSVGGLVLALPNTGQNAPATAGQVMMFALPLIVGLQALMTFVALDTNQEEKTRPLSVDALHNDT